MGHINNQSGNDTHRKSVSRHPFCKMMVVLAVLFTLVAGIGERQAQAATGIPFVIISRYSAYMDIGDSFYLIALTSSGKKPTFKSEDSKIASVDTYGRVTAKKAGRTYVVAKINGAQARCAVTVRKTEIVLNMSSVSLECNQKAQITSKVSNGRKPTYKVDKKSVATVSESGVITAVKPGEAVVSVSADGTTKNVKVKVRKPTVKLDKTSISLYRTQTSTLKVQVSSGKKPTFRSSRSSVATVDENGVITAIKNGTATITVSVDGVSKTCTVVVKKPAISLNIYNVELKKGTTAVISASVSSGNKATYSSSNTSVAVVWPNGLIKAVGKGTCYIYAQEDGTKVKCKVVVKEP